MVIYQYHYVTYQYCYGYIPISLWLHTDITMVTYRYCYGYIPVAQWLHTAISLWLHTAICSITIDVNLHVVTEVWCEWYTVEILTARTGVQR